MESDLMGTIVFPKDNRAIYVEQYLKIKKYSYYMIVKTNKKKFKHSI